MQQSASFFNDRARLWLTVAWPIPWTRQSRPSKRKQLNSHCILFPWNQDISNLLFIFRTSGYTDLCRLRFPIDLQVCSAICFRLSLISLDAVSPEIERIIYFLLLCAFACFCQISLYNHEAELQWLPSPSKGLQRILCSQALPPVDKEPRVSGERYRFLSQVLWAHGADESDMQRPRAFEAW